MSLCRLKTRVAISTTAHRISWPKGLILVTQEVCKELIAAGKSGSIVNIGSVGAQHCSPRTALYAASKAALEAFSKSAAKEMSKHNIRVNVVSPSVTKTPMLERAPMEHIKGFPPKILEHLADPREVAQVILFLASDRSSYVSGSSYSVTAALI